MRAAVDVMGGDKAPQAILQGCWDAAGLLDADDSVILVGDQAVIAAALQSAELPADKEALYRVVAATQVIAMDDPPVEAIRSKPNSSISVMCKLAAAGEADVVISAGNTGACVAASQLRMRLLPGVTRPGIAVIFPTLYGPVAVCDCGANISPQPRHLLDYAIMAGAYLSAVAGVDNPRVGLLSIGEEDAKGTAIVKESRKLLRDEPQVNFIGNVEGRDLFRGVTDVVVCDGFVGNIVLKMIEGLAEGLFRTIITEVQQSAPQLVEPFQPVMQRLMARHDYAEHGGAPLLGVSGYTMICHGRSDHRAIKNAIRVGKQLVSSGVNQKIVERIARSVPGAP